MAAVDDANYHVVVEICHALNLDVGFERWHVMILQEDNMYWYFGTFEFGNTLTNFLVIL